MSSGTDPRIRQLKIKTGVCKRSGKEKASYVKEAEQQKAKIEKMKAEGKDEYEIRKMGEVGVHRFDESIKVTDSVDKVAA